MSSRLALSLAVLGCAAAGCGINVQPIEAYDVVLQPTQDCTLTGSTSRDCTDDADLAAQQTKGRWVFEAGPAESFTLTTEEGFTLPGIYFPDDATVLNEAPCIGTDGSSLCYFARRKFESSDDRNNGCTTFGELVAILLRTDAETFSGVVSDTAGTDQNCGTSTVVQRINAVSGKLSAEPSLARQEAAAAP